MKTLIIITLITLSLFSNFCYASKNDNRDGKRLENIDKKIEEKNKEKALKLKAKEDKIKNKIKEKFEKKLAKFDNLSDEKKLIVYEKLIEKIDIILGKENISKTQKAVYTLLKEIIIERKNSIKK